MEIFGIFYKRKSVWRVIEQTWHYSGKRCKIHKIQVIERLSPFLHSMRTGWVKSRFGRFRLGERVRNVHLHVRHYLFFYVFSTRRWVSDTETLTIPGEISIFSSQVLLIGKSKMAEGSLLWGILRRDWRNMARCRYDIVIGAARWNR